MDALRLTLVVILQLQTLLLLQTQDSCVLLRLGKHNLALYQFYLKSVHCRLLYFYGIVAHQEALGSNLT